MTETEAVQNEMDPNDEDAGECGDDPSFGGVPSGMSAESLTEARARRTGMMNVLREIAAERGRQFAKWGDQADCADADPALLAWLARSNRSFAQIDRTALRLAEEYGIPSAGRGKFTCATEAERHGGTFAGIVIEELAELIEAVAISHASDDVTAMRAEAIQAAACLVQWIEAMDRRGIKATPQRTEARR